MKQYIRQKYDKPTIFRHKNIEHLRLLCYNNVGDRFMKAAICDDEKVFRDKIAELISEYGQQRHIDIICDKYSDGKTLLPHTDKYDIIFIDYQMRELNGIDVSRKIREKNKKCIIIFVSAYPEIALDAFEVDTFRFLSKPVDKNKFFKAMDDYSKSIDRDSLIQIKSGDNRYVLCISDIIYVEAKLKHCIVRTADNAYEIAVNLKAIEKQLPPEKFARSQRSYIAGLGHIKTYSPQEIIFDNGERAVIGKKYSTKFRTAFEDYIIKYNEGNL